MTELRTIKEIGVDLRRGRTYVQAMKAAMHASGVPWIGNRITIDEVVAWLREHPGFRTSDFGRRKGRDARRRVEPGKRNLRAELRTSNVQHRTPK